MIRRLLYSVGGAVTLAAVLLLAPVAASPPSPGFAFPAAVVALPHDGDTMQVEIRVRVTVRLCGDGEKQCWSPELKEPGGIEARSSLNAFVGGTHGTLYVPMKDTTNLSQLFTFGRVLGDYWPEGSDESASQRQVRTKHASTKKGGKLGE